LGCSGTTYEGFDIEIIGKPTHPGKNLSDGINALQIFLETDWMVGLSDDDRSRINVVVVNAGTAPNVVPETVEVKEELRTILDDTSVAAKLKQLEENVKKSCEKYGVMYTFSTHLHPSSYAVNISEPLVQLYKRAVEQRGGQFVVKSIYVGSDANAFRAEKGLKVFTIATGIVDEHTKDDWVKVTVVK
jgi:tripeptide aminopeptidase